jgi:hypothetical protein
MHMKYLCDSTINKDVLSFGVQTSFLSVEKRRKKKGIDIDREKNSVPIKSHI